jgi:hypothetical protein
VTTGARAEDDDRGIGPGGVAEGVRQLASEQQLLAEKLERVKVESGETAEQLELVKVESGETAEALERVKVQSGETAEQLGELQLQLLGEKVVRIPPAAFRPTDELFDGGSVFSMPTYSLRGEGIGFYWAHLAGIRTLIAPVTLPDGAEVRALACYIRDAALDADLYAEVNLWRSDPAADDDDEILATLAVDSGGAGGAQAFESDVSDDGIVIDGVGDHHWIEAAISVDPIPFADDRSPLEDLQFRGCAVTYRLE